MSRRNSSLVTVTLGNLSTDEETPPPYTTTTVIEIGDDDEINSDARFTSSTERIFHIVVEDDSQQDDVTLEHLNPDNQLERCSKLRSWFRKCCNGNIFKHGRDKILAFTNAKLATLHERLESRCEKSYLETYFLYANVCGVSPFRFGKENKPVVWLKKVPYYIVNTLAAFDTLHLTKRFTFSMIGAYEDGSPEIGVYMLNALAGATILLRIGFFVSLKFHPEKYFKVVQTISVSKYRKHLYTKKKRIQSMLICFSSISLVLIKTYLGFEDGLEAYLKLNVKRAVSIFCITRSCQQSNVDEFSSTATVALGLLGWATTLAGIVFSQIARDGVLFSALTLGESANAFRFKERVTTECPENENNQEIGREILAEYEDMKKISKHINSAFNIVFRFFLLTNIFVFAVFLDDYFDPRLGKIDKMVTSLNVVVVCTTFYYANLATKTGERFRDWMKKESIRNILGLSQLDVITETLSSSAIGYGRGALFIYDSTLIGFAGVVAAYFLGIVETRKQYLQSGTEMEASHPSLNNSTIF